MFLFVGNDLNRTFIQFIDFPYYMFLNRKSGQHYLLRNSADRFSTSKEYIEIRISNVSTATKS